MLEVKTRSKEAWGPLSSQDCDDEQFRKLTKFHNARKDVKEYLAKRKKLKKYGIQLVQYYKTDPIQVLAETQDKARTEALKLFKEDPTKYGFVRKASEFSYDGFSIIHYGRI